MDRSCIPLVLLLATAAAHAAEPPRFPATSVWPTDIRSAPLPPQSTSMLTPPPRPGGRGPRARKRGGTRRVGGVGWGGGGGEGRVAAFSIREGTGV